MLQVPEVAKGIRPNALPVRGGQVEVSHETGAKPRVVDGDQPYVSDAMQDDDVSAPAVPQKANLDRPVGGEFAQQHLSIYPPLLADAINIHMAVHFSNSLVWARLVAFVAVRFLTTFRLLVQEIGQFALLD